MIDNNELKKEFEDQLELLDALTRVYDKNEFVVSKSIATTIRVLLHNTKNSHSLIEQIGFINEKFFDSSSSFSLKEKDIQRFGSFCGLVGISTGINNTNNIYIPYLDSVPEKSFGYTNFDEYWERIIFIDKYNNKFSRKDIILNVANKGGGAHVDFKNIDEKYKKLVRKNSLGFEVFSNGKKIESPEGAELAAVRQIAHEILKTFKKNYPHKTMITKNTDFILSGTNLLISKVESKKNIYKNKIGRNEKCICGSGKKYKKCCGI